MTRSRHTRVRATEIRHPSAKGKKCPKCGAAPGWSCTRNGSPIPMKGFHKERKVNV